METRAIVFSSGASTMFTKSYWPSTAHWAVTVAPSCSISLFTSRIRCGLLLRVCTPSGVRVLSITNVGTGILSASGTSGRNVPSPHDSLSGRPRGRGRARIALGGLGGGADRVAPEALLQRRRIGERARHGLHPVRQRHRHARRLAGGHPG